MIDRNLDWPSCLNIRDLGGLPTEDDRRTKTRSIVRSNLVNNLTPEGETALLDYGIRTMIDLRAPHEVKKKPSRYETEPHPQITYINQPVEHFYSHVGDMIRTAENRGEAYCIILDHYQDLHAAVMRHIIDADGGILIHCHAGKDRTGVISALLLKLVGVSDDAIAADYGLSQERLAPMYKTPGDMKAVDYWHRPDATADKMMRMLNHIDAKYDSVANYLSFAGLSAAEIDKLKGKLIAE